MTGHLTDHIHDFVHALVVFVTIIVFENADESGISFGYQ